LDFGRFCLQYSDGKYKINVEGAEDIRTPNNKIHTSLQLHSPFPFLSDAEVTAAAETWLDRQPSEFF
jgi:hypothetical protein